MDAILMFDVLMYLNLFYYPLVAISHPVMTVAKFFSPNYKTPDLIEVDAAIVITLILSDLLKIILFRKFRERQRVAAVIVAVALTCLSLGCILYILLKQEKVMRMEYIICTITFILFASELLFGTIQFMPCFKKIQY